MNKFKFFLIFLGILVVLNLAVLNWWVLRGSRELEAANAKPTIAPAHPVGGEDVCGEVCQRTIRQIVEEAPAVTVIQSKSQPTASFPEPKVVYMPLVTEGSVSSVSWTDIVPSDFYFDLNDYPGVKEVRFQAYLLSANNDEGSVCLYDQTNLRSVDYSDLHTKNSTFTRLESSPLVIWRGNNKYTIQLRSVNGTQVKLKDAKLKIIF